MVGNGDLLGFWHVLGRRHLETFRAWDKNRQTQFPGARGTFRGEICLPQILPEIEQLFSTLRFGRPDPQGREIAKYWFSRTFWPRAAPWHLEKFRVKNRKTQLSGARGSGGKIRPPQKFLPEIAQPCYCLRVGQPDPHRREIAKYSFLRPLWPRREYPHSAKHGVQYSGGRGKKCAI